MSDTEEEMLLLYLAVSEPKPKKKRYWVRPSLQKRNQESEYNLLLKLMSDEDKFYNYLKFGVNDFYDVLHLIRNDIKKQETRLRMPISEEERLAVTLKHLTTGDNFKNIGDRYRIASGTVGKIVSQVCKAIWKRLQPLYIAQPTMKQLQHSAEDFKNKWSYPNCVGAVEGKFVVLKTSNMNSLVLLVIVDANCRFLAIDVVECSCYSDGIFFNSNIGQKLYNEDFNIPVASLLPNTNISAPYVLVGDETFPLTNFLMRPYSIDEVNELKSKQIYNFMHFQAKSVSEKALGMMVAKFQVFKNPMSVGIKTARSIVKASCALHNYVQQRQRTNISTETVSNIKEAKGLGNLGAVQASDSHEVRDIFTNYFALREGSVTM